MKKILTLSKELFYPESAARPDISNVYKPGNMFLATQQLMEAVKVNYHCEITPAVMMNVSGPIQKEDVVASIYKIKILQDSPDARRPEYFRWTQRLGLLYKAWGPGCTFLVCQGSETTQNTLKSAVTGLKHNPEVAGTSIKCATVYDEETNLMYFAYAVFALPEGYRVEDTRGRKQPKLAEVA
jgi:hypothetical protein